MHERLKKILEEIPGSVEEKAKALGVSHVTLYSYLAGKTIPNTEFLLRLKKLTSIDIDWLLTGEEEETQVPGQISTLIFDFISAKVYIYISNNNINIILPEYAARSAKIYNFLLTGDITNKYFDESNFQENIEEFSTIIDHLLPLVFDTTEETIKTYIKNEGVKND
ncbi:helix-turn-helix domain-containing protein [Solidesulfovibrio alcoholivorans]|uniref:helix-turn-helix domain-containing protein n=1 Tax=Solidesulfovibrio alcoholivorans TaxID=81406 RepID=UPI0012EB57FA|nr:helix-turn-helix domain-containing protein [Solidesulfovibrio alcoholivorans]